MSTLEEKGICFSYTSNHFDCNCGSETHEVFATVFKIHALNLIGFPQNYFATATCCCWSVAKDVICNHCQYLPPAMNFFVPKICFEEKLIPKYLELLPIKTYLNKKLPGNPICYFLKKKNSFVQAWTLLTGMFFFLGKGAM